MTTFDGGKPPETIEEAAQHLFFILGGREKDAVAATPKDDLHLLNFGFGADIRNAFGLWRGNLALLTDASENGAPMHPDDVSALILNRLWELVTNDHPK